MNQLYGVVNKKKSAYIINKFFTMLPFAIIWLMFDSIFIIGFITSGSFMEML